MNSREYTESSIYSRGTCEDWIKAEVLCYVLKGHGGDGGHNFKNQSEDNSLVELRLGLDLAKMTY